MFIYVYSVVCLEVSTIFANFGGLDSTSRASKRSSIHSSPWLSWWLTILKSLNGGHENPKTVGKNDLSLQQTEGTTCWERATWTFCCKKEYCFLKVVITTLDLWSNYLIKITLGSLLGKEVSLVHLRAHEPHSLPNLRVGSFGGHIPGVAFRSSSLFVLWNTHQGISIFRVVEVLTSHRTLTSWFSITVNYENDLTWSEVNSEDSSYQPSFTWYKSLSLNLLTNSFPFCLTLYSLKCWRISSSGFFQQPINSLSLYFKRLLFGLCTP